MRCTSNIGTFLVREYDIEKNWELHVRIEVGIRLDTWRPSI